MICQTPTLILLFARCHALHKKALRHQGGVTPNLPTNIVDFRGFDSSTILIYRGGIPRPIGKFPESLTQAILVGTMLVGGLGVWHSEVAVDGAIVSGLNHLGRACTLRIFRGPC